MFTCFSATSSDTVTDILMWLIYGKVGADWRDLGTVLGLESAFLDNTDNHFKDCGEKAWAVLRKWGQKNGKEATVGILRNALVKIERRDVVDELLGT